MIDLHKELYKLCQLASGNLPAIDYLTMLDVRSTASKEDRALVIAELNLVITKIKRLCTEDEVAMFEFYFQKLDQDEQPLRLLRLAKIAYPENLYVGTLIAKKWRGDKFRADELIAKTLKCSGGEARKIVGRNKSVLTALLHQFLNTDYLLADKIEDLLLIDYYLSKNVN